MPRLLSRSSIAYKNLEKNYAKEGLVTRFPFNYYCKSCKSKCDNLLENKNFETITDSNGMKKLLIRKPWFINLT